MRLINVKTYTIQEFFGDSIPEYAILSHTWGEEEVTFKDMQQLNEGVKAKLGYKKIEATCQQAERESIDWAWVDTCCIDKTSSAELSEAINSMFRWYSRSKVCYAFLSDVDGIDDIPKSRWFTRGWTLQELLAPSEVVFYSANWVYLGSKTAMDYDFDLLLLRGSKIPLAHRRALTSFVPEDWTIADRMSWASARQTTRVEDIAYCLLGLFDVNMSLLYGEGDRAFVRLQEEIMRVSDDQSIFAWADTDAIPEFPTGVLAQCPAKFANSRFAIDDSMHNTYDETTTPYKMSNHGIHTRLMLIPLSSQEPTTFYGLLGNTSSSISIRRPAIIVRHIVGRSFCRIRANILVTASDMEQKLLRSWYYAYIRVIGRGPQKLILRQTTMSRRFPDTPTGETTSLIVDYSQLVASSDKARISQEIPPKEVRVTHSSIVYAEWNNQPLILDFRWLGTNFNLFMDKDGSCVLSTPNTLDMDRQAAPVFRRFVGADEIVLHPGQWSLRLIRVDSHLKPLGKGRHVRFVALHSLIITDWLECFNLRNVNTFIVTIAACVIKPIMDRPTRGSREFALLFLICVVMQLLSLLADCKLKRAADNYWSDYRLARKLASLSNAAVVFPMLSLDDLC